MGSEVGRPVDAVVEADRERAEAGLYTLAVLLRRVPVGDTTRSLHLRALQLKREVSTWLGEPGDSERRARALEEIDESISEARLWLSSRSHPYDDGTT